MDPVTTAVSAKLLGVTLGRAWTQEVDELADVEPGDVQGIAASQLKLLGSFYSTVLQQARQSFEWALIGTGVGIMFFMAAIAFVFVAGKQDAVVVSAISGGVAEVIAAINFVLYGKAILQLPVLHARLEQTQRFLLANSLCESMPDGDARNRSRAQLIATIAGYKHVEPSWADEAQREGEARRPTTAPEGLRLRPIIASPTRSEIGGSANRRVAVARPRTV